MAHLRKLQDFHMCRGFFHLFRLRGRHSAIKVKILNQRIPSLEIVQSVFIS